MKSKTEQIEDLEVQLEIASEVYDKLVNFVIKTQKMYPKEYKNIVEALEQDKKKHDTA